MRRTLLFAFACVGAMSRIQALDLDASLSAGLGAAIALGGDFGTDLAEFAAASGASAYPAPVLGQYYGAALEAPLGGAYEVSGGLAVRRLGYAMWSPDGQAMTWLSLWTIGARLGLAVESRGWFAGAGFTVEAPISGVSQSTSLSGVDLEVDYDTGSGRMLIPGGYLEAGYEFGGAIKAGKNRLYPRLALQVGAWPFGVIDGVETAQLSACLLAGFRIDSRGAK